ncbi:MAG: response regulator [Desulfobacteraceae bacterium]|jgi:CheY-like chemotaxis protein|nr:response regulator [Desulfobacteraceae bacterium]
MENPKILVVDDESDMQIYLSTVVETMGFEPIVAGNGPEALKKARAYQPALVILDVMMPGIEDGLGAYQQFREDAGLGRTPIIMLSAIAKKTFFHSIRLLKPLSGKQLPEPEAYMEKPPDAAELNRLITMLLQGD